MVDPELLLNDIQTRKRQRREVAAKDRLASENPHPVREVIARTGEALVQIGTQLRAWGGASGQPTVQPAALEKWSDPPTIPNTVSPKPRACTEPLPLTWEKGEGAYWVTVSAPKPSR